MTGAGAGADYFENDGQLNIIGNASGAAFSASFTQVPTTTAEGLQAVTGIG